MTSDNFYLQNRLIQTSQTGGQQYSDTSPFSIPKNKSCLGHAFHFKLGSFAAMKEVVVHI